MKIKKMGLTTLASLFCAFLAPKTLNCGDLMDLSVKLDGGIWGKLTNTSRNDTKDSEGKVTDGTANSLSTSKFLTNAGLELDMPFHVYEGGVSLDLGFALGASYHMGIAKDTKMLDKDGNEKTVPASGAMIHVPVTALFKMGFDATDAMSVYLSVKGGLGFGIPMGAADANASSDMKANWMNPVVKVGLGTCIAEAYEVELNLNYLTVGGNSNEGLDKKWGNTMSVGFAFGYKVL